MDARAAEAAAAALERHHERCGTRAEREDARTTRIAGVLPPLLRPGGDGTGLETKGFEQSCEIVYRGKKLEGDTEKEWRKTHACKGSAQAELEHERVHQKICQNTFAQYPDTAVQRLTSFRNIAESELQAWKKHRDLLREEIQKLARNCGWEPTDRQRADPDSVPTETQTKKMEERGWKAFNVLSSTPP